MAYNDTYQDSQANNSNVVNGVTVTTTTYTRKYIRTSIHIAGVDPLSDIFFQHHSAGLNLLDESTAIDDLVADGYDLYDMGYNDQWGEGSCIRLNGIEQASCYDMPNNSTDYSNWPTAFGLPEHDPPDNWLSWVLTHDVIIMKACFMNNANVTSDALLTEFEGYIESILDVADAHLEKLFIVMTNPPLLAPGVGIAGLVSYTDYDAAHRARLLTQWMANDLATGHPNVKVFDFFDLLANADDAGSEPNCLKTVYWRGVADAHPNTVANAAIGPVWAAFIDSAIKAF